MDRDYRRELDMRALAVVAMMSRAHFIRSFRDVFGETPHRYLQRRRVERAMYLLRLGDHSVTEVCVDVGFTSLGTFSRTFSGVVGVSPSAYRRQGRLTPSPHAVVPSCFVRSWTRPSTFGEAIGDD